MKISVDGNTYDFDAESMRNDEAMLIEKQCGVTFKQWGELLEQGSVLAMTALVWIIQRRENPALLFEEVRFEFSSLEVEEAPVVVPPPEG
jgi:hypothetical protein